MNTNTNAPHNQTRDLRPQDLANSLFGSALRQHRGNEREAALQTITFLTEALVAAVTAASGDNNAVRVGLLQQASATVAAAATAVPAAAPEAPVSKP